MKIVSFASAASASLVALLTVLVASGPVPAAADGLPGPKKKVCNMKTMIAKDNCVVSKPPTKKPTAAVVKKPTKKPSKRPTRFPTAPPTTHRPSTALPTASPSGSPTTSLPAECPSLGVPVYSHRRHLYARVAHGSFSWDQANEAAGSLTCCGAQGNLLVVGDAPERDFITATYNVTNQYGWIGLTDVVTEGTYVWTDGTTLDPSLFVPVTYAGTAEESDHGFFFNNPNSPAKWFSLDNVNYALDYSVVEFDCSTAG
jgi:Lectin C-type domain